jgi:hypothetical protein
MSFSNFLETEILDHVFANNAYTAPATIYIGLHTSNPDEDDSGAEVSGGSYARQSMAFSVTGNTASNTAAVEFPTATAPWGTVTHVGLYDASTSGNLLAYAALSASKAIDSGDVLRIPIGDMDVTLD